MSDFGSYGASGDLGFQLGSIGGGSAMDHQWRIPAPPQFPFLGGLEAAAGGSNLYGQPFDGMELSSLAIGHVRSKGLETAAVKMEGSGVGVARQQMNSANLARQFNLGMLNQQGHAGAGEQFNWGGGGGGSSSSGGGNAWTDMSGINNSSCSTTSAM